MRAYLAAGWFSDDQEMARKEALLACNTAGLTTYSPKDDFMYVPGETPPTVVFEENLRRIVDADIMVASTAGKDMGTLFECGYAFAQGIPIVYYYTGEGKFNLMLSESSAVVCTSFNNLVETLETIKKNGVSYKTYKGEVE